MTTADSYERAMLALVNEERTSRGLTALQLEQNLNQSAEAHSEWMLGADVFSHTGAGGSSAGDRMTAADFDFSGSWTWAENLAVQSERGGAGISDDVVDLHNSLMNSAGHRANILNPDLKFIGIGVERGSFTYDSGRTYDSVIVTQNFAATQGSVDLDGGQVATPVTAPVTAPAFAAPAPAPQVVTQSAINGTNGANRLEGTSAADVINGYGGNDQIFGRNGNDLINAGDGNDRVYSGGGNNQVNLGAGNDLVSVTGAVERFDGGSGTDTISYYLSKSAVNINLDTGGLSGGLARGDRMTGFENATGSATGSDRLYGNEGSNTLKSYGGNDILYGRAGNDKLSGGNGRDHLEGDGGNDVMYGGAGADVFHFDRSDDRDRIKDFEDNVDTIQLDNFAFRSVSQALDTARVSGNDVVLELGGGDRLWIDDVTIAQLANDLVLV